MEKKSRTEDAFYCNEAVAACVQQQKQPSATSFFPRQRKGFDIQELSVIEIH